MIIFHPFLKKTYFSSFNNLKLSYENDRHDIILSADALVFDSSVAPFNTFRPWQNGSHYTDNIFKCILLNQNVKISIKISLKFVPKDPIDNIPSLVQIMAWRPTGYKPLSEPMMVRLPMHIYVTQPQWVNTTSLANMFILQFNIYYIFYLFSKEKNYLFLSSLKDLEPSIKITSITFLRLMASKWLISFKCV